MLRISIHAALVLALTAGVARAQPAGDAPDIDDAGDTAEAARRAANRVNLRLGTASTDDTGRPTICLEIKALGPVSVEGCGTGSGFLHSASGGELAHFRAKARIYQRAARGGLMRVQAGLGLAELQLDADQPGFEFGAPTGRKIEAAGPEAAMSVQWLRPLARGWELVMGTSAGAAWIPHAGELAEPQGTLQPFVSFEAGMGW